MASSGLSGESDLSDDEDLVGLQQFHNTVRENIIFLLFFLSLCVVSWTVVASFLKKRDASHNISLVDDDESNIHRICFWLCVFSLSISIGATLLLPISIVSNEVLLFYPNTYYVKWLNGMLIHGIWNLIFLFANISIFVLLPLAYLLIESEGFSGHKKGVSAKFYEAMVVLTMVGFTIWGIACLIGAILSSERIGLFGIGFFYQLPFVYSCISFLGVLFLLVCTPLGFVHLFTVLSQYLVGPEFLRKLEEEYLVAYLEVESLKNKLNKKIEDEESAHWSTLTPSRDKNFLSNGNGNGNGNYGIKKKTLSKIKTNSSTNNKDLFTNEPSGVFLKKYHHMTDILPKFGEDEVQVMKSNLLLKETELKVLEKMKKTPGWKRNLLYPLALICVLVLTALTNFMVIINTLQLIFGIKSLPYHAQTFSLGLSSMGLLLGSFGAAIEVVILFYLITTSLIGLYNLPGFKKIRPKIGDSSTHVVIYNCGLILILSSALPVLARILGITNFDLMGNYGKIEWLGNFYVVLLYNLIFSGASTLCLTTKFTSTIRQELLSRFKSLFRFDRFSMNNSQQMSTSTSSTPPPSASKRETILKED